MLDEAAGDLPDQLVRAGEDAEVRTAVLRRDAEHRAVNPLAGQHQLRRVASHPRNLGNPRHGQQVLRVGALELRRHLAPGETLTMSGHMHDIDAVSPRLIPAEQAGGLAPYYLAANKRLKDAVAEGEDITIASLDLEDSALYRAWQQLVPNPDAHAADTESRQPKET